MPAHRALAIVWSLLATGWIAGCGGGDGGPATEAPVVRVGVLPDQIEPSLRAQYGPLLDYLDRAADVRTELVVPDSYEDLVERFRRDELDLAWFGGFTFLRSDAIGGAEPLAMRDVDLEFTSDYLVAADAPGQAIEDFAGTRFAFGPELSTSGHVMPRYFLTDAGIVPEDVFGSVVYSSGHDETARMVRDGAVDIGVANSVVVASMFRSGELSPDDVRVLTRTVPYRDYTWATQTELDDSVRRRLLDALLALDPSTEEGRAILEPLGAGGFVPATRSDFDELRAAADASGLLE